MAWCLAKHRDNFIFIFTLTYKLCLVLTCKFFTFLKLWKLVFSRSHQTIMSANASYERSGNGSFS